MTDVKGYEILRKIEFGSAQDRIQALVAAASADIDLDDAQNHLYPIAGGSDTEDPNERIWALIALSSLGDRTDNVKNSLLDALKGFAAYPECRTPIGLMEKYVVKALSNFKNNPDLITELIDIIRHTVKADESNYAEFTTQNIINACLCCIGVIGDETGRGILEYWLGKGNLTAKASLDRFGMSWDEIQEQSKK